MERLRIYTALKLLPLPQYLVFLFQYPLNLHCSQTRMVDDIKDGKFQYPLNLHCSQTR